MEILLLLLPLVMDELQYNPFMRCDEYAKNKNTAPSLSNYSSNDPIHILAELRRRKDNWKPTTNK